MFPELNAAYVEANVHESDKPCTRMSLSLYSLGNKVR